MGGPACAGRWEATYAKDTGVGANRAFSLALPHCATCVEQRGLAAPLQPSAPKQTDALLAATRSEALRPLAADGADLDLGPESFGPFL